MKIIHYFADWQLIQKINTSTDMTNYPHLAALFHEKAVVYGSKTAQSYYSQVDHKWHNISWSEFITLIDDIACALLPEIAELDKIGIFSRNMPWWTIADIAVMSVRGISIPVYSTDSVSQVSYILKETGVNVIFAGEQDQYDKLLEVEQELGRKLLIIVFDKAVNLKGNERALYFDDFAQKGKSTDRSLLTQRMSCCTIDDLTTIIYTSGTTGEPKGVMLHYRNFSNTFKVHDAFLTILPDDHSLAFLPLSHIFERAWSLYALYRGIKVTYLLNPREVIDTMKAVKPTIMCAVPRFYEKTYNAVMDKIEHSSTLKKTMFRKAVAIGRKVMELKRTEKPVPVMLALQHKIADRLVLSKGRSFMGGKIRFMPCSGASLPDHVNIFFHSVGVNVIYAYGLTETTATVTAFRDTRFKFGTAGKPLEGIELKIGPESEIWVRSASNFSGYYNKPAETDAAFQDGWFKTGDAGLIDEDGNLIMTERIKDLIKTSTGKYVAPQQIETLLTTDPVILQAMVVGDNRRFISALIVPDAEKVKKYAADNAIAFNTYAELLKNPEIIKMISRHVDVLQEHLADFQKVKRFALLETEFSIDSGDFTSTLKMKRKVISGKYSEIIENFYSED